MTIEQQIMVAAVSITTDNLTDQELAVLNFVAQTDDNPHDRIFDYEKVEALFSKDGKMHEETKNALATIVLMRLK